MALNKTRYEGLYYRVDKHNRKVYVARIYKDGKDTTKTLGKEPDITLKIANKMRLDLLDNLGRGWRGNLNSDTFNSTFYAAVTDCNNSIFFFKFHW